MALEECPECGNQVSTTAESCPQCGYRSRKQRKKEKPKTGCGTGCLAIILAFLLITFLMSYFEDGCYGPRPVSSPPVSSNDPAESVGELPVVEAVKRSMTAVSPAGRNYRSGLLHGGTAVLVDDYAAYWVYDGVVYAANGAAKMWSPGIEYASDASMSYDSVKDAASY